MPDRITLAIPAFVALLIAEAIAGAVMHAMVRRSIEEFFQWAHGTDKFGVDPELVE